VSDLTQAMREAVASVDADRRGGSTATTRHTPAGGFAIDAADSYGVRLVREGNVQPSHGARQKLVTASFEDVVRHQLPGGRFIAVALRIVREALLFVALFWMAAMLVAFGEDGGTVAVPGLGAVSALTASVLGGVVLRGVFAALTAGERYFSSR
jgi:hypothetical protein